SSRRGWLLCADGPANPESCCTLVSFQFLFQLGCVTPSPADGSSFEAAAGHDSLRPTRLGSRGASIPETDASGFACSSNSASATAPSAATCLRCGSASVRH